MSRRKLFSVAVIALLFWAGGAFGQSVAVTVRLDTNRVAVGSSTFLRIYAQVLPAFIANSDRIFSWYIDVLNTNAAAAQPNYASMQKPVADNDPQTSSPGTDKGSDRCGIYDTFLNSPGAGVSAPVELLSVPVSGNAPGRTSFIIRAGTGVPQLSSDFIVARSGGGNAFFGGDYSVAVADLQVVASSCALSLQVIPLAGPAPNSRLQLTFSPCSGFQHTIESRAALGDSTGWQPLGGGPHNSGSVTVTNLGTQRFFRVHAQQ